jgi:phosphate-selective porin OprO and OprP
LKNSGQKRFKPTEIRRQNRTINQPDNRGTYQEKTMKFKWWLVTALGGTQFAAASFADGTATNSETNIQTLKQEVQRLEQKVDNLERQQEENQSTATNASTASPHFTVGPDGANFISANSNFVFGLHGWLQVDSRTFFQNGNTPGLDGFILRRARLIFSGTAFHDFDYNFTPEFAGSSPQILDAYVNYHYDPELQLEVGKFKPPVGLEALEPDIYTFLNERSLATDLVPYRSIGAELHGDLFGGGLSYAAGILNGLPDYTTTTINQNIDNDVAFAGRLFATPFKPTSITPLQGLGFGVSGSYEHDDTNAATAGLTPGYTTDGQEKFFTYSSSTVPDGAHWRISPQGYYYWGPFGLIGEYVVSDQRVEKITAPVATADLRKTGWEVSGGWVLTGENDSYNGIVPRHPFNLHGGGWGAWQVVGRFAELNVDHAAFPDFASPAASASGARAWAAGLNWYLNKNLRANVSFSRTWFTGDATSAVAKQPENVLFTRMQLAF